MASEPAQAVVPGYELYPYQRQVLHDLLDVLIQGKGGRVVAHLPTGAGKTRIACHAAATLLNQRQAEGKVIVWVASSEELCEQAVDGLAAGWRHLGNRQVDMHRYWGPEAKGLDEVAEGFLVAGLPKLWATGSSQPGFLTTLATRVAGVIFDEAHQAVAPTYEFVTEQLVAYGTPLLGLTATPGRTPSVGEQDYDLAKMFNERKVTIDPRGHGSPVAYLISQGYLAEPEFIPVTVDIAANIEEPSGALDYSSGDLEEIGRDQAWIEGLVSITLQALQRHRRVMVFCPSVRCALEAAREVERQGQRAASIVAATPLDQRREKTAAFRDEDPEPMALFNYGVLTAGFDAPRTRCVIVARPTTSLVLYSQMVGRAMRGPRSNGNRRCEIYTVVDTSLRGFGSVVEAFANWEEMWLNPTDN